MCVIGVSNKKIKPSMLKEMWEANSDGAGFAFLQNGNIHVQKGFQTYAHFIKAYEKIPQGVINVVHFRIASSGPVDPYLTHPFIIGEWGKTPLKFTTQKSVLFHNGTWPEAYRVAAVAALLGKRIPEPLMDTRIIAMIAGNCPGILGEIDLNRFVVLDTKGYKLYGEFTTIDEVVVSNTYWRRKYEIGYNSYLQFSSIDLRGRSADLCDIHAGKKEDQGGSPLE